MDSNIIYEKILKKLNTGILIVNKNYDILLINSEAENILKKNKKGEISIPEKMRQRISFEKGIERCEIEINKKILGASFTPIIDGELANSLKLFILKNFNKLKAEQFGIFEIKSSGIKKLGV